MKSINLAVVFVDIAGFTERTGQQSRAESEAWLLAFERLLMPLIRAFDGRRIKTIGDAYLCTFASPTNALLFGMAAQDRVFDHNRQVDDPARFQIRVAVNAGEVRLRRRDIFGEPVNIAARVEGLTPAGEIWFTEAVHLAMTRSEVPAEEIGQRTLRGIAEPVKLYRVPTSESFRLEPAEAPAPEAEAGQADPGPAVRAYPFGGLGLQRAEERGWTAQLGAMPETLARAGRGAASGLHRFWTRLLGLPRTVWYVTCGTLVALLLLVALAASLGGSFGPCLDAIEAGQLDQAQRLLDGHAERATPLGQAIQARIWLRRTPPQVGPAWQALERALGERPDLAADPDLVADLVATLNRRDADETIALLVERVGSDAVEPLLEASLDKRFHLRWNSLKALKQLGEVQRADLPLVYVQDLKHGSTCRLRKRAAQRLAELADERALPALRAAKERPFFENLCMGSSLDEAIKAIEQR